MRRLFGALAAITLLLVSTRPLAAQSVAQREMKPVLVVSLVSYQELRSDVEAVGRLAGNPELADGLESLLDLLTRRQGLAGLDRSRPMGLAVQTDGVRFPRLGFIPVESLDDLLGSLDNLIGPADDVGGGIRRVGQGEARIYLKAAGSWAYASDTIETLAKLPDDPLSLLEGLPQSFDLAVRMHVQNIPPQFRDFIADRLHEELGQAPPRAGGESEQQFAARSLFRRAGLQKALRILRDVDHVTAGWSIDGGAGRMRIDLGVTFVEGSVSAALVGAEGAPVSTEAAEFLLPGALAAAQFDTPLDPETAELLTSVLDALRAAVQRNIDGDPSLADAQVKRVMRGLIGDSFNVVRETWNSGRLQGGAAVVGEGPFTLVIGGAVANGMQLDELFRALVASAPPGTGLPAVALDAEQCRDVNLHTLTLTVPETPQTAGVRRVFGDGPLEITLGFGPRFALCCVGRDGRTTARRVIEAPEAEPGRALAPVQASISLGQVLRLASAHGASGGAAIGMLAAGLEPGSDHLHLTSTREGHSLNYRLEAEPGLLRMLGGLVGIAQGGIGQ